MALPVLAALLSLALSAIALLSPLLSHWPLRPGEPLHVPLRAWLSTLHEPLPPQVTAWFASSSQMSLSQRSLP